MARSVGTVATHLSRDTAVYADDLPIPMGENTVKVLIYHPDTCSNLCSDSCSGPWSILFVEDPGNDKENDSLWGKGKLKSPGLSLPGGGIDPGESVLRAAIREVKEETGMILPEGIRMQVVAEHTTDEGHTLYILGGFFWKEEYRKPYSGPSISPDGPFNGRWIGHEAIKGAVDGFERNGGKRALFVDSETDWVFYRRQFALLCSIKID